MGLEYRRREYSKYLRITAVLIGLVMLFLVMLSFFYVAKESCHHCASGDCPVCHAIRQCEDTLRRVDGKSNVLSFALAIGFLFVPVPLHSPLLPVKKTPVAEKVRMDH